MSMWYTNILGTWIEVLNRFENLLFKERDFEVLCNTPKYILVVFDMFRVFCKPNLTVL